MISSDPTKAAEELEKWAAGLAKKARGYTQLQQRLDETSVTAVARDGAIRVTVDANGVPTQLDLSERARELPAGQLSAEIMGCMRQAQARLREQVKDLIAGTVPADDEPRVDEGSDTPVMSLSTLVSDVSSFTVPPRTATTYSSLGCGFELAAT